MPKNNEIINREFVCVNCGRGVDALFKRYSDSVLKIIDCEQCQDLADKYIEFEPVIVILDLILLKAAAYRHVLYNTSFKIKWKLAVALLLLEAYIMTREKQKQDPTDAHDFQHVSTEKLFYFSFFMTVIDKILLLLLLRAVATTHLYGTKLIYHYDERSILSFLFKTIILAGLAKLFLLPIVIWHSNTTDAGATVHLFLVTGYYFLSMANVYAVVVNCSRAYAAAQLAMVLLAKTMLFEVAATAVNGWKLFQYVFQE